MPVHLDLPKTLPQRLGLLFLWLILLLSGGLAVAHPYHQSLLELEVDEHNRQLQGALKLLPEDFAAIQQSTDIETYLQQNLRINRNDTPLKTTIEGIEKSPQAIWIYLSWPLATADCKGKQQLQVVNTLLFETNDHFVNTVAWKEHHRGKLTPKAHNLTPDESRLSLDLSALQPACVNQHDPAATRQ